MHVFVGDLYGLDAGMGLLAGLPAWLHASVRHKVFVSSAARRRYLVWQEIDASQIERWERA